MQFEVVRIRGLTENVYLLTGDTVALVDTGMPSSYGRIRKMMCEEGVRERDIELILVTHHHVDHAGNVRRIKEASAAHVIAGAADAPVIEGTEETPTASDLNRLGRLFGRLPVSWQRGCQRYGRVPVDRRVTGGEMIEELGLEVIPLPGHTPGGVGFMDREGRRAFTGDLMSYFLGRPGMPAIMASESLEEILKSQEKLAGLGLEVAYPGHGWVIGPGASGVIGEYSRKKRAKLSGGV